MTGVTNKKGKPLRIVTQVNNCFVDHLGDLYVFNDDRSKLLLLGRSEIIENGCWINWYFHDVTTKKVDFADFYQAFISWLDWHYLEIDKTMYLSKGDLYDISNFEVSVIEGCSNVHGEAFAYLDYSGQCYIDKNRELYVFDRTYGQVLFHLSADRIVEKNWIQEVYENYRTDFSMNDFIEMYMVFLDFNSHSFTNFTYRPTE